MATKKNKIQFMGDPIGKKIQSYYDKILNEYAKLMETDIVMILCHGDYGKLPANMDFEKFYIFVQLLPRDFEGIGRSKIKEFKINNSIMTLPVNAEIQDVCPQGDSLKFSKAPKEAYIIEDGNKQPMAAVYDSGLYIMNDFIHCRGQKELESSEKTFHYIMKEMLEKSEIIKYFKSSIEEKSKRTLQSILKELLSKSLDKEKIHLRATKDTINQYEKGIVDCSRKIMAAERMVLAIKNNINDIPSTMSKKWGEISRLNKSKSYENISFMKTGIKGVTTPIIIKHKGKEYDMGKYEVILTFDGKTAINKVNPKENENVSHPHVNNGVPCWGNMAGVLPRYIGSTDFDMAFLTAHEFLSHYDEGSPYRKIENWPLVNKSKKQDTVGTLMEEDDSDD